RTGSGTTPARRRCSSASFRSTSSAAVRLPIMSSPLPAPAPDRFPRSASRARLSVSPPRCRRDVTRFHFAVPAMHMRDDNRPRQELVNEVIGLRKQVQDLKDAAVARWRAEQAVRRSEEEYRALVEEAPGGICRL